MMQSEAGPASGLMPPKSAPTVKPPRWKRLAQNLALSLGVFVLCLGLLELILRWNGFGNLEIYQADPVLYWRLKPNQDCYTKIDHQPVHINSHGTRGPDFQTRKPPNTLRILSLGDSRTFGWGLKADDTYSGVLQRLLQDKAGKNRNIEVINAGVNAWSYPQLLVYFREVAIQYEPDVVLVGEANLWTQFSTSNNEQFVRQVMRRVALKNFLRHFAIYHYVVEIKLKDFYERERIRFIPIDPKQDPLFKAQQQTDPMAVFRSAMEDLGRLAQARGIKPILLYLPGLDEAAGTNPPPVLKIKQEVSQRLSIPLVELLSEVHARGKTLYLEGDPVHFNSAGNAIIARRLFDSLNPFAME